MKNKKSNKIITFSLIFIILFVSILIFVLNYTKDDYSFSILEKKWISDYKDNIINVSIYNDVPLYGKNGKGISFTLLDEFTKDHEIKFNKIPYFVNNKNTELENISFKVLNSQEEINENQILMYEDHYVLLSNENKVYDKVVDISDVQIGVLSEDIANISYYLGEASNLSYTNFDTIDSMLEAYENGIISYLVLPNVLYLDIILENDLNIIYHINELNKKYIIEINNNDNLLTILKKYYKRFYDENYDSLYSEEFVNLFFDIKNISDQERANYNSNKYVYGFVKNMPYESVNNNQFIGTISNYVKNFSKLVDVDFQFNEYNSINELKNDLVSSQIDFAFANFNSTNMGVDIITSTSPFEEQYVIVAKDSIPISSIRSLKNKEVNVVKDTKIYDYLVSNNILIKGYNNLDDLLVNIDSNSIVALDYDTYNYYHNKKLDGFNILYTDELSSNYNFIIRKTPQNDTIAKLFTYYVSSINYNEIRYLHNSSFDLKDPTILNTILKYLFIFLIIIAIIIVVIITMIKKKKKENVIKKEEKLKFIDLMTSLKNRNYLNYNISKWDENVIYPQTIIIIDLNNIKYINDNHGHEEGDNVIKKAASILIVNQLENSDIIRTDGNEFLIYMVGYSEKQIVAYTRKIYKELKELPYGFGAAIGYSMITDDIKTIDDAINEATLEMRDSKEKQ